MDILLLILLGVGLVRGLFSGAVRQVVSLAAFVVGYVVACLYYERLGDILTGFLSHPELSRVLAFALLWIAVPVVAKLIASLLTSLLDGLLAAGVLNRVLGGLFGLAKYAFVLGTLIWFFARIGLLREKTLQESRLCLPLKAFPELVYDNVSHNVSAKAPCLPAAKGEEEESLR